MSTTRYNPGTCPSGPVKIGPGVYSVDSFTGEGQSYQVNLNGTGSCTCPHYQKRIAGTAGQCKHQRAARAAQFAALQEKAKGLPTAQLSLLLEKHEAERNLLVALAIRSTLQDRQQVDSREAALKAVFA
jgi:SWIM zinc finger